MSMAGEGRDIRLDRVLESIQDGSQKARADGLKDLRNIFDRKFKAVNIDILSDKAYHKIYEVVFRAILSEKQSFLQAKKSTKSAALTRLTTCSSVVRVVVKAGAARLKSKTVEAVVDHITQTLPRADGEYCVPIAQHYLQALASVVDHKANVERMKWQTWLDIVDFCLRGIAKYVDACDEDSGLANSFSGPRSVQFSGTGHAHIQARSITRHNVEDILQALQSLVSVPNAPVLEKAEEVARLIVRYLRIETSTVSQVHQIAFSILNNVLLFISVDRIPFVQSVTVDAMPIISRLWQGKALAKDEMLNVVRDEMVKFLFTVVLHLTRIIKEKKAPHIQADLEEVLEVLKADYSRRLDRDQLQLDDIEMADLGNDSLDCPFNLNLFRLKPHRQLAERHWGHLQAIALLEQLLYGDDQQNKPLEDQDVAMAEHPRKRQRVTGRSDRLSECVMAEDEGTRLAGLQMVPFILQECELSSDVLPNLITKLISCSTDKRGNVFAWTLMALASCLFQRAVSDITPQDWNQLWQIGARALTFSVTCRSAAILLHTLLAKGAVRYQDVAEDISTMLSAADITGPVILCDSSMLLMMHLLHVNMTEAPASSLAACNHVMRWFFTKWNPVDKTMMIEPHHTMALLRTSLGLPRLHSSSSSKLPWGSIAQSWQQHLNNQDVLRYLLLLESVPPRPTRRICSHCPRFAEVEDVTYSLDSSHFQSIRRLIFELLLPKLNNTLQTWNALAADRSSQVSTDLYRAGVCTCITILSLLPHFADNKASQYHVLESDTKNLIDLLLEFLQDFEERDVKGSQSITELLLDSIHPYLPPVGAISLIRLSQECPRLLQFFVSVSEALTRRRQALINVSEESNQDSMDVDDEFTTQRSQTASDLQKVVVARHALSLELSSTSFYLTVSGRLLLIQAMIEAPESTGLVPSNFVDQFLSMRQEEVLSCRGLLREMFDSDFVFDGEDAAKLIEYLGSVLSSLDYERCEVALGICLDTLNGLEHLWSTPDGSSVSEAALQLYQWFINVAIKKNIASPAAEVGIARLLLGLNRTKPEYGLPLGMPSPRTSLYEILKKGNIIVKFYIGFQLPDIFGLFTLKQHDDVFVDLLKCLPSEVDEIEGIAFRMFVLAKVASKWPGLLRRCVYHIFEVPGRIPDSMDHATRCMVDISLVLNVDGPKSLFVLFEPQILYTWLLSEPIEDIPYQIFGFTDLKELLIFAKEETSALMLMRGQEDAIKRLAQHLRISEDQLSKDTFTKALAYTIGYDLSIPQSNNKKRVTGESRLRKCLGQERYFECVNLHFVDIIATLFCLVDCGEDIEKPFEKEEGLAYAGDIMRNIKKICSSEMTLPLNQQPAFRAKYFTREIQHLCSRTEHKPTDIYTPALVTSVARKLLNTIHPALGSLHACSVLRKMRLLIALAGNTATTGYPLEMLLHAIRPFIADSECADDAIGIIQYLLSSGTSHLVQSPSFVAGISMSIMGSLRTFLRSTQASTTQDTQYKATKSKAQKFHMWVGKFAAEYDSPNFRGNAAFNFHSMLKSAHAIGRLGNAELGTAESQLLAQLLKDESGDQSLLNPPSRKLAHAMLCSEFECPPSFRADIFGQDQAAVSHSAAVWRSCKGEYIGKQYFAWAARVLGRAFAASGHIQQDLLQEYSLSKSKQANLPTESDARSKASILGLVHALTLGDDPRVVGLAEASLRFILSSSDEPLMEICQVTLPHHICVASTWAPYQISPSDLLSRIDPLEIVGNAWSADAIYSSTWIRDIILLTAQAIQGDPFLHALRPILSKVPGFADEAFASVVHIALSASLEIQILLKKKLSTAFGNWLGSHVRVHKDKLKTLVNAILYLRTQAVPGEKDPESKVTKADRANWLDIDYAKAAAAAIMCGMFKTALLFSEQYASTPIATKSSRRSSMRLGGEYPVVPTDTLLAIFENIDDPDMYYGVQQSATLGTILARLEHEKDGAKSLAFRGAQYDSHLRRHKPEAIDDAQALLKTLNVLSLSGLSHSLFQSQQTVGMKNTSLDSMFQTARKLEQWDIPVPEDSNNNSVTLYKAFQVVHSASSKPRMVQALNESLERIMRSLVREDLSAQALHGSLQTLAALTEMDEVLATKSSEQFEEMLSRFQNRAEWMKSGRFEDVHQLLSCRATILSTLSQQPRLQQHLYVALNDARLVEVQAGLLSSTLSRAHSNLQVSLSLATALTDLIPSCLDVGLGVEAAVHLEAANALWDQGEMTASIGMLQALSTKDDLKGQTIPVSRSSLLSKLGHQVSVARLEKADGILEKYLKPALKELNGKASGSEASEVFHQFAMFCDQQLQDPDGLEDLQRLENLTRMKQEEVAELEKLRRHPPNPAEKQKFAHHLSRAKQWLNLDKQELQRQYTIRDEFLIQSLESYLLALNASDKYSTDALRFTALWLEHSNADSTNRAVSKYLDEVPSRRFAPLMNQLTSRLLDNDSEFQKLLFALVLRICTEHPYHGMYQIYAGVRSAINTKDDIAVSRKSAASKISDELKNSNNNAKIWQRISGTNDLYCVLAGEKNEKYKQNRKISFKDSMAATNLNKSLPKWPIPPPTMQIPLAADMNYSKVPRMVKYEPQISIASGVSAPKIITGVASNGERFRQLVKGGSDDLRQDAIMEQVFAEVSELLKNNRTTRQRNLSIRTYKVLPLTSTAGIIEFVPNTIPLHEFLMPAHDRYFPGDIKASQCRKEISEVQSSSNETRVKRFRSVIERFHPVMHFFFIEKFDDPDEWFVRRLAYTRSTAANSMLGHVLGLGDRHGHNILLDSGSGEVVHIDLGIAFEMGRVLPVPELVPFRLTRDIIDGMGITKTEGVFRRCCEFTLEALRKEVYSIMTILDVLRYDPLYSWSISPVRLAKMQEAQSAAPEVTSSATGDGVPSKDKKEIVNQPSEADRALTVVNKKLSKTLSVTATVNDLINQATDEKNLAVLFSGWAAYA